MRKRRPFPLSFEDSPSLFGVRDRRTKVPASFEDAVHNHLGRLANENFRVILDRHAIAFVARAECVSYAKVRQSINKLRKAGRIEWIGYTDEPSRFAEVDA